MKNFFLLLVLNVSLFATSLSAQPLHNIGDTYGGGVIFYLTDASGQHGLIAAPRDQNAGIRWGGSILTLATKAVIGSGQENTILIKAGQATSTDVYEFAANICSNYYFECNGTPYGDWYLPSKDELNLMYTNIGIYAIDHPNAGHFTNSYYWCSTEFNKDYAWEQDFNSSNGNTNQRQVLKSNKYCVRAIRSF